MRKLLLTLVLAIALSVFAGATAEPAFLFAPCAADPYETTSNRGCALENCDTYLRVVANKEISEEENGDPHFVVVQDAFDSSYEWIKLRIQNHSDAPMFEMHFASTASGDGITAETCTHFPISTKDTEYKEYVFNVKKYNLESQSVNGVTLEKSTWDGSISKVRFDCMWIAEPSGQVPKGSTMDIDYIAFFDTEEDAKAFVLPAKKVAAAGEEIDYSSVEWENDNHYFITSDFTQFEDWGYSHVVLSPYFGNLRFTPTGADPIMQTKLAEPFKAEEYPFFAYRYKVDSEITAGGIFFQTDTHPEFAGTYTNFEFGKFNEWTNLVIDMRNTEHGLWKDTVTHFRLDALNGSKLDEDALVVINRFGFFKTREEAMAFLAAGTTEDYNVTTVISGGNYFKAIIPANAVSGDLDDANYSLSTENHKTEGTPSNVVYRTNADGSKELIAMSYTNEYGFTSYAATKPGTYELGTNHKDYSDIAGHWGESYINFVSDRTLFGGTSPTEFSPEDTMTRGMFITVLGRMHGLDQTKYDGNTGYTDVPATEYYAPYIQWAKETGIMAGTSDTTFAPEEPITRATMAVAIKNYTDKSGFEFEILATTEGFNDLAGLDEATVNAINTVKNVGIINGKGEGRFDPNGISTRAEVATVMERTIKACLGVLPNAAVPKAEFTKDRVAIGLWGVQASLATPEGIADMADLGANLILNGGAVNGDPHLERVLKYADLYGIEVYLGNYFDIYEYPTEESAKAIIDERDPRLVSGRYLHHPSFAGHYEGDEPGSDHFPMLGDLIEDYEAQMPGKRAFENLLPMYANAAQLKFGASASAIEYYDADPDLYKKHCQGWVDNVDTDYICTDIYPLQWTGGKKTTYRDYLESINQIATVARDAGREFWCCIQTFGWNEGQRTPNVAEYRWQTYCMFSFGCTGILLWNYMGYENFPSLVHPKTLEKTPAFYDCKVVMQEINAISDVFMQYKNLGAYTVNTDTAKYPYQKMSNQYTEFTTISDIKTDAPLLIGCFDKKDGNGKAFTIVNLTDFQGNEGLVMSTVSFALEDMSKTVTAYYHGEPKVLTAQDGMYKLNLEVGDGLFITVE